MWLASIEIDIEFSVASYVLQASRFQSTLCLQQPSSLTDHSMTISQEDRWMNINSRLRTTKSFLSTYFVVRTSGEWCKLVPFDHSGWLKDNGPLATLFNPELPGRSQHLEIDIGRYVESFRILRQTKPFEKSAQGFHASNTTSFSVPSVVRNPNVPADLPYIRAYTSQQFLTTST